MTLRNSWKAALGRFLAVVTGLIFLGACGGSSSSSSSTSTPAANNTAALSVGFGPTGQAGGYTNLLLTTVTVCEPGTTTCQTVDNVLVDTGSIGLRILNSAFTTISASSLGSILNNGDQLQECVQYGDTSYTWGPMLLADVEIAGEKASSIPIQVIGDNTFGVPAACLAVPVLPGYGNDDTVAALGANGILGIEGYPWDCGSACDDTDVTGNPYYFCPTGQACSNEAAVATTYQATNPGAAFSSSDNNGVLITLSSISASGAADGSVSGSLIFGIGTQTDNALASTVTIYAVDDYLYIPQITYNGISYISPGEGGDSINILDTGSNAFYVSDANTLASSGIIECADEPGYYCPTSAIAFSVTASGALTASGTGTITFNIMNADTLFNSGNAAFNDLGGDGGTAPSNDVFDFGLPFFFGKSVYIGMAPGVFTGESAPPSAASASSAPYGYFAF